MVKKLYQHKNLLIYIIIKKIKKLLLLATVLILSACSRTGVQVANDTKYTIYQPEVSYYDKDGALLNTYPIGDSLVGNAKSKIMDVANRADYAKITFDMISRKQIKDTEITLDSVTDFANKNGGIGLDIIEDLRMMLKKKQGKEIVNKYYIEEDKITEIVFNGNSKVR